MAATSRTLTRAAQVQDLRELTNEDNISQDGENKGLLDLLGL